MGTYQILLFAGLRDACGTEMITLNAEGIATVEKLLEQLCFQNPQLEPWLKISRVAVNQSFVQGAHPIDPTCEIALIPPVSGG
jgi:molybdopterin converting factor subunit 1